MPSCHLDVGYLRAHVKADDVKLGLYGSVVYVRMHCPYRVCPCLVYAGGKGVGKVSGAVSVDNKVAVKAFDRDAKLYRNIWDRGRGLEAGGLGVGKSLQYVVSC